MINERSLPIAWELVGEANERKMQPICITAKAPFCFSQYGFDETAEYVKAQLAKIPTSRLRRLAAKQYAKRFHSTTAKNPERSANIFLRETVKRVTEVIARSPLTVTELNNKKRRQEKAKQLASICDLMSIVNFDMNMKLEQAEQLVFGVYIKLHDFALSQGINPPAQATFNAAKSVYSSKQWQPCNTDLLATRLERAIRRMTNDKWWLGRLNRLRDMTLEHLNITMGLVNKRVSPYASRDAVMEFKNSKRKQNEWLKAMIIEAEDGTELSLAEVFKSSVANPELRRIELMVRVRGYQEWAEKHGLIAMFYTVTAPSKYHANSAKYGNYTPRDTQAYLVNQWAKVRATLAKDDVEFFGLRVAEPHADATPHWHMLLFMRKSDEPQITKVIKSFALQDDPNEKGAAKNRFDKEFIDPSKGSAVGYIAKYISKNINANHIEGEIDEETGKPFESEDGLAVNVLTWASRWRIRQFQFIGGAPVGLWREFRRVKVESVDKLTELTKEIFESADNSRFAKFIELLGGAFTRRSELPVQLEKELSGINEYGEDKIRVVGFRERTKSFITRAMQWRLKKAETSASRSTGNNCNQPAHDWQIGHGEKLNPICFIPIEVRDMVMRGATYLETDEDNNRITQFKVKNGSLVEQTYQLEPAG